MARPRDLNRIKELSTLPDETLITTADMALLITPFPHDALPSSAGRGIQWSDHSSDSIFDRVETEFMGRLQIPCTIGRTGRRKNDCCCKIDSYEKRNPAQQPGAAED